MKIIFFTILLLLLFISCRKSVPNSDDFNIIRKANIYFIDKQTNANLIGYTYTYNKDSLWIYSDNDSLYYSAIGQVNQNQSGNYYCYCVYLNNPAFLVDDIIRYDIDLPIYIYINSTEKDTINVKKRSYEGIRFYYKELLVDSINALDTIPVSLIIKK